MWADSGLRLASFGTVYPALAGLFPLTKLQVFGAVRFKLCDKTQLLGLGFFKSDYLRVSRLFGLTIYDEHGRLRLAIQHPSWRRSESVVFRGSV
jgi:hypothetical protein